MHIRIARSVALVAVVVAVAGCTKSLDTSSLESELKSQVETQLAATGFTVSCPDNVKVSAGSTFECTATGASGQSLTLEVTQTDDQGRVSWKFAGTGDAGASATATPTM